MDHEKKEVGRLLGPNDDDEDDTTHDALLQQQLFLFLLSFCGHEKVMRKPGRPLSKVRTCTVSRFDRKNNRFCNRHAGLILNNYLFAKQDAETVSEIETYLAFLV